jgi:hypothetical protein
MQRLLHEIDYLLARYAEFLGPRGLIGLRRRLRFTLRSCLFVAHDVILSM